MKTAIVALALLLGLQLGGIQLHRYLQSSERASVANERGAKLLSVEREALYGVRIRDNEGKVLELAREGGGWVVQSAGGFPADRRAQELVDKLLGLEVEAVVARSSATHGRYEVKAEGAKRSVELLGRGGDVLAKLYLGRGAGLSQFVRVDGKDEVVRLGENLNSAASTRASGFVELELSSFDAAEAIALAWSSAGEPVLTLERFQQEGAAEADWRITHPVPAKADRNKAMGVVNALSRLYFSEPIGADAAPAHGLTPPNVLLVATLASGEKVELEVGSEVPGGNGARYARLRGKPFVVTIAKWTLDTLLKEEPHFRPVAPPFVEEPPPALEGPAEGPPPAETPPAEAPPASPEAPPAAEPPPAADAPGPG